MKSKFLKLGLAVLTMVSLVQVAQAAPVLVLLDSYSGDREFGSPETDIYMNITFKINDRYSFTPETNNIVFYNKGGQVRLVHDMLRLTVNDSALGKIGDWTLKATYQYVAPTNPAYQIAANLGALYYRPAVSRKFGGLELTIRNRFGVLLNRGSYATNVPLRPAKDFKPHAGNGLIDNMLEANGTYDFGNNISLGLTLATRNIFVTKGAGADQNKTRWSNRTYQELELGYTAEALAKTAFSTGLYSEARYGQKADYTSYKYDPYGKETLQFFFRISKTFE